MESQTRAAKAWADGDFDRSIVPVTDRNGLTILDHDEHMRETTLEGLGGLKPSFAMIGEMGGFDAVVLQKYHWVEKINHVHHGGNSSGIVDGAALVLVGSEAAGKKNGLTPRARIVATAVCGADPTIMLTGPTPACQKVLAKAGLTVDDIDLLEINEAFAAVPMKLMKDMGFPHERTNVNWRRHRAGPPARRHRRDAHRHDGRRARAPRPAPRPRHAVHRWRHGHRHHHRARVATTSGPGRAPRPRGALSRAAPLLILT